MPCVGHKVLENVHEDSIQFPNQNSRFLCNRPDGSLKGSGRPSVSKSFSVADVRTTEQHRPDARSSYSEFDTELDFSRHYLGSFCKTSERRGNTYGRYKAFQNIPGFLYRRGKEWQWRSFGRSAKPSGRGPVLKRIALFWKGGRRRPLDEGKLPSGRYSPESDFEQN
jgi:hypothetical protein